MYNSISSRVEEDPPVEAEHHYRQEDGNYHLVHRLYGSHASYDGQTGSEDGQTMEEHWP